MNGRIWTFLLAALVTVGVLTLSAAPAAADCLVGTIGCDPAPQPEPAPAPQPAPAPPPAPSPAPAPQPPSYDVRGAEARLTELVNRERVAHGLRPAAINGELHAMARTHSERMAAAGEIFHSDELFTSAAKKRLGARRAGENVASNMSVDNAHVRLMDSPPHRANILDPGFTVMGIGVAKNPDGRYYITEMFIEPSNQAAAPAPAPAPATPKAPPAAKAPAAPKAPSAPAPRASRSAKAPAAPAAPAIAEPAPPESEAPAVLEIAPPLEEPLLGTGEQAAGPQPKAEEPGRSPLRIASLLGLLPVAVTAVRFLIRHRRRSLLAS